MKIADKINHVMKARDLTKAEITQATGIDSDKLSTYTRKRKPVTPGNYEINQIAKAMNVSAAWLADDSKGVTRQIPAYRLLAYQTSKQFAAILP